MRGNKVQGLGSNTMTPHQGNSRKSTENQFGKQSRLVQLKKKSLRQEVENKKLVSKWETSKAAGKRNRKEDEKKRAGKKKGVQNKSVRKRGKKKAQNTGSYAESQNFRAAKHTKSALNTRWEVRNNVYPKKKNTVEEKKGQRGEISIQRNRKYHKIPSHMTLRGHESGPPYSEKKNTNTSKPPKGGPKRSKKGKEKRVQPRQTGENQSS